MAQTTNTISTASKDILARILAGENLTIEHSAKAHTAMFDTKSRILTMPMWDNMSDSLYDMLIGHEVGHALFTPWTERDEAAQGIAAAFDIGGKGNAEIAMDYLNVVEDTRIERMVQDKFPGLRRDFYNAYKELVDRDFFGIKGINVNDLPLLDRLNIKTKLGTQAPQDLVFTPAEQTFIDRMNAAQTFDEVTVIASDLFSFCGNKRNDEERKQFLKQIQTQAQAGDAGEDGESSMGADGDESADGEEGDDLAENNIQGENQGEEQGKKPGKEATTSQGASEMLQTPARSITQQAFNESLKKHKSDSRVVSYGVLDTPKIENIIWDYKNVAADISNFVATLPQAQLRDADGATRHYREIMGTFMRESTPTINNMVKQFEMRKAADRAKRTSIARSGVLDTVRMMSYKYNEDIFRRNAVVADGKSHGMVMFIDWSSSMCGCLMDTVKQLALLVMFCRKVNIPFEVYAFTSTPVNTKLGKRDTYGTPVYIKSDFWTQNTVGNASPARFHPFMLLNLMSSRMSSTDYKQGLDNLFRLGYAAASYCGNLIPQNYLLGSTPLDEAIVAAMDIVPKFRDDNRLQIVNTVFLTDGASSGNSLPRSSSYARSNAFITDPVTRKTYQSSATDNDTTDTLLRIFRDRTKTNAIGFFLCGGRSLPISHPWYKNGVRDDAAFTAANESWRDHGFAVALPESSGYTEWYIVSSSDMRLVNNNDMLDRVGTGASVAAVTKAMIKDAKAKNKSRILLGRFIDLIAR